MIDSLDEAYIKTLRNNMFGYANVSVFDMIQHLFLTYGNITPMELENNNQRIRNEYDVTQPFEVFISQIEDSIEFAMAGGTPFTHEQVLVITYNILFNTGAFKDECKYWRKLPPHDRTWPRFKDMFSTAHKDLRRQQTTGQQGYNTANKADMYGISEAVGKLAEATQAYRETVANLTQENAVLTQELQMMRSLQRAFEQLQRTVAAIQPTEIPAQPTPPTPTRNNNKSNANTNNNGKNRRHTSRPQ